MSKPQFFKPKKCVRVMCGKCLKKGVLPSSIVPSRRDSSRSELSIKASFNRLKSLSLSKLQELYQKFLKILKVIREAHERYSGYDPLKKFEVKPQSKRDFLALMGEISWYLWNSKRMFQSIPANLLSSLQHPSTSKNNRFETFVFS